MSETNAPNFFLVESPLQLLCATEARERFGAGPLIIKETGSLRNNQQLEALVKQFQWRDVHTLSRGDTRRFGSIRLLLLVSQVVRPLKGSRIFVGDYRSRWMQLASNRAPDNTFLLDDGLAMAEIVDRLNKGESLVNQSFGNALLSRLLGLGRVTNRSVNAFSFLPLSLKGKTLYKHRFEQLQAIVSGGKAINPAKACFIGSRYVENQILEQDELKRLLLWAKEQSRQNGQELVYLPHRYESQETLDLVESLGIKTRLLENPVEMAYLQGEVDFSLVYGLYSTLLVSVGLLIQGVRTVSIRPPMSSFKRRIESVEYCYDLLSKFENVEIVDV